MAYKAPCVVISCCYFRSLVHSQPLLCTGRCIADLRSRQTSVFMAGIPASLLDLNDDVLVTLASYLDSTSALRLSWTSIGKSPILECAELSK
ncbi:uncharacterized protein C8Q71DRAFT_785663 [Rhodofomes roseus]|uniref:F-box domain-containing protein n=1 Tax=Rhodofomes roseus TaxID=34475 RepID=A0ABQ8K154_9APHY|nr:uncharacterized protein C8Q71DRAFT_785663 [Rhodofomes roseus]KAH9830425.1 hypothetical protein C8Q71DRAFT_785663 [Rhodofomes roseus]